MLQRKQSLWLFIAALLGAGVVYFDIYKTHTMVNGVDSPGASLRVADHFPSLLIALVMTALPLVTIFLFNTRKRQINLAMLTILADVAFIALQLWRVSALGTATPPPTSGSYWIGAVLPVAAIVFLIMGISGIRRDDKLVRSVDRLR
jgi:uncharacterized membrane protein YqjE